MSANPRRTTLCRSYGPHRYLGRDAIKYVAPTELAAVWVSTAINIELLRSGICVIKPDALSVGLTEHLAPLR
jgi:hypothetical protein